MELPTPKNADTPKQKKHREQAIVVGTLLLVILTFVLVVRRGTNADPGVTSDGSNYTPDAGGGGPAGDFLPSLIGGIPGQTAALEQGQMNRLDDRLKRQSQRLKRQSQRLARQSARLKRLNKKESRVLHKENEILHDMRHPGNHGHPKHPHHPVHHSTHAPHPHAHEKWVSRHPPQHHGKRKGA